MTAGSLYVSDAEEAEVSSLCRLQGEVTRLLPALSNIVEFELWLGLERADLVIQISIHLAGSRDAGLKACVAASSPGKLRKVRA